MKLENSKDENASDGNDNDNGDDEDDDDDDENSTINDTIKEEEEEKSDERKNHSKSKHLQRISDDVNEGKTVFLKNVPFSVKNDELKRYMEQFGPVCYALVCIDHLTEHSKGTAFVKFKVRFTSLSSRLSIIHFFAIYTPLSIETIIDA